MKANLLYVDFPMTFEDANTGGSFKSGAKWVYGASNKYQAGVLTLDQVKILCYSINDVASLNCIIAMWGFIPLADQCMEIVNCFKQFGFEYKTKFFWIKNRRKLGMGRYFRNEIEELIFLKRGNVKPFGLHIRNYFFVPPLEHSKKPIQFRRLVELIGWQAFKTKCNFLELFARSYADGWDQLGYDVTGNDIVIDLAHYYGKT